VGGGPLSKNRKLQTNTQPQVPTSAKVRSSRPGIVITCIALFLGGLFTITIREILSPGATLEHTPAGEINSIPNSFRIANNMTFFKMNDTCVSTIVSMEMFDNKFNYMGEVASYRLGDIGSGKLAYMQIPPIRSLGNLGYGSVTLFVQYSVNLFGIHWLKQSPLGTCRWIMNNNKLSFECSNTDVIPLKAVGKALEVCNK
jgi:hypothetical protein